ncbi:MAG: hypothetical protein DMD84_07770 [Candidatus Rokuibacteriota bacterium]|nr:MAG: hypothetical protein DMD84_07770 [Candidatus Rokubacteria bacterium]
MVIVVGSLLLVLLGSVLGSVLAEAAYRIYLRVAYARLFQPPNSGKNIAAYDVSHWEFDERFGYVYPAGRIIAQTNIADGRVTSCQRWDIINKDGNIGKIVGDYHEAELKVLVFGDSWSAFHHEGRTWPLFLQEVLEVRLNKKVHVVNFGRDGYGILQMFDLAAAKIAEWKPDLVVFAFITDDLDRARFWRTVVGAGDDMRVLTVLQPRRDPDPETSADTYLLMPSATYEWCERLARTRTSDAVLERIIRKHRALLERNNPTRRLARANVLTLRHSFLYNRVVSGDAFAFLWKRIPAGTNPRVSYQSYAEDPGFLRSLDRINTTGVPWVLFHLAFYPEIKAKTEYILRPPQKALLDSLEAVTGKTVLRTTDYVRMPVPQAKRMNATADDNHPSLWGMEFYANAVAEALVRHGLVKDPGHRSRTQTPQPTSVEPKS